MSISSDFFFVFEQEPIRRTRRTDGQKPLCSL